MIPFPAVFGGLFGQHCAKQSTTQGNHRHRRPYDLAAAFEVRPCSLTTEFLAKHLTFDDLTTEGVCPPKLLNIAQPPPPGISITEIGVTYAYQFSFQCFSDRRTRYPSPMFSGFNETLSIPCCISQRARSGLIRRALPANAIYLSAA